jgi:hypothetical protein
MAPEVGLGHPYNQKCDVYSFTVLLWEMLSLKRPYDKYSNAEALIQSVFEEGERPLLNRKWPTALKEAFKAGWDREQSHRLSMAQLGTALRNELSGPCDSDDEEVSQPSLPRRRSTLIFKFSDTTQPVMSLNQQDFNTLLKGDSSLSCHPN